MPSGSQGQTDTPLCTVGVLVPLSASVHLQLLASDGRDLHQEQSANVDEKENQSAASHQLLHALLRILPSQHLPCDEARLRSCSTVAHPARSLPTYLRTRCSYQYSSNL